VQLKLRKSTGTGSQFPSNVAGAHVELRQEVR
jgi:hypothetical protein